MRCTITNHPNLEAPRSLSPHVAPDEAAFEAITLRARPATYPRVSGTRPPSLADPDEPAGSARHRPHAVIGTLDRMIFESGLFTKDVTETPTRLRNMAKIVDATSAVQLRPASPR